MSPAIPIRIDYRCPRLETAAGEGRAASVNGNDEIPPYEQGTAEYFAWLSGWAGSRAIELAFIEDHPDHGGQST